MPFLGSFAVERFVLSKDYYNVAILAFSTRSLQCWSTVEPCLKTFTIS